MKLESNCRHLACNQIKLGKEGGQDGRQDGSL